MSIKKRFKEEKVVLETDRKRFLNQIEELKSRLEHTDAKLYHVRKEVEESPMSLMRSEIQQKQMEVTDLENRMQRKQEEKETVEEMYSKLKKDYVAVKRQMEQ